MIEFTNEQIAELAEDPNLESIHAGRLITDQYFYSVYTEVGNQKSAIMMEAEDDVLVSKHKDGTYFMHFMSLTPKRFHYKAPWVNDEQTTMEDEAIYHV